MYKLFLLFFSVLWLSPLWGIPLKVGKVNVDGDLSDPVWQTLPWKSSFTLLGTKTPAPAQTRFKTFHDQKNIYFAVECDEPAMEKIRKNDYSANSSLIWMNDSVELNLVPDRRPGNLSGPPGRG